LKLNKERILIDLKYMPKWFYRKVKPFLFQIFLIVVTSSLASLCSVAMAITSKNLVDSAVDGRFDEAITNGILFVAEILLLLVVRAATSMLSVRVHNAIENKMRLDIYRQISYSDWLSFSKYHSEEILTRMTSDVGVVVNGITNVMPGMISLGVQLIAAFITLFMFDRTLGLLAFCLGPVSVLLYRLFGKKLRSMHLKTQELEAQYRAVAHESIQNMIVVKAFILEDSTRDRMEKIQKERLAVQIKRNFFGVIANSTFSIGYWTGYFLAFAWGALRLAQKTATFGSMTAFLQLVGQVQSPFIGLAMTIPQLIATEASASRLTEVEKILQENRGSEYLHWTRSGIVFENVSFSYDQDNVILSNVSFEIKPGETVGLVGPSGEGKTTMIRMILALLQPQNGKVLFVNDDERIEASASSRSVISYVPQGNTLFSGTIEENLRIVAPDATDEEIKKALVDADAWDFINELPDGIHTKVGEKAVRLSEGQAQRITIARAFLRKSAILLLDEATSALDADTEMRVLESIRGMQPERTCIIITHRPSALRICSRVLRIQDGILTEEATHKDY
jgi:ATP-binding cassette subfamily B protein